MNYDITFSPTTIVAVVLGLALLWQFIRGHHLARERDSLAAQLSDERTAKARLETELEGERKASAARIEELRATREQLEQEFSALATKALKDNMDIFLTTASDRFKTHEQAARAEVEKRKEAIEALVKPLNEKLQQFDNHLRELEKARSEAYGAIMEQAETLAKGHRQLEAETRKLVQALKAPQVRGRWGELQLKRVFELAGMTEHVDFDLQQHVETDEGSNLRPDAIVHIPGDKIVVIDVKTPLEAYLKALEAVTPEDQQHHLQAHASQMRTHVDALASRDYQNAIDKTPDFVVMFVPGETFVSAALEADPSLLEFALGKRVLIATPTTLVALVKAIAYGWQQQKLSENAEEIRRNAQELYNRLGTFADHLGRVGNGLQTAVNNYNRAVGSLTTRVLPAARRFENLGVIPAGRQLAEPNVVENTPRILEETPENRTE